MSIFRELFVEVSSALLEAAVAEALQRPQPVIPARESLLTRLSSDWFMRRLSQRYRWVEARALRAVDLDQLVIHAQLPCGGYSEYTGHVLRVVVDEFRIQCAMGEKLIGLFDAAVESAERGCYCVERKR